MGLNDTDTRLTDDWQLTQAADGDTPLCSGLDCLYQNIALEAFTQLGDPFCDLAFGWGPYDFIQNEDSELTQFETAQRPRFRLQKREVIVPESISIPVSHENDAFRFRCTFRSMEEDEARELDIVISPVGVEVAESD